MWRDLRALNVMLMENVPAKSTSLETNVMNLNQDTTTSLIPKNVNVMLMVLLIKTVMILPANVLALNMLLETSVTNVLMDFSDSLIANVRAYKNHSNQIRF